MSVISGKIVFCEGGPTSLDAQLLNRILKDVSGEKAAIVGSGGKFTFPVFAAGYFAQRGGPNRRYLVFRDRDFDRCPATENAKLLEFGRMFLTHRACIENYLLDAHLMHRYWCEKHQEKLDNPNSKWGHGDSPGVETLTAWINEGARNVKDYQAVRWALGELLQKDETRTHLKTTWTGESGRLPASLTLDDCRHEAIQLIERFRQAMSIVTVEAFETQLTRYKSQFEQSEFWEQKHYLIWFHGKDVQKAMQRLNSQYISLQEFFKWAVRHIDFTQHADLNELRGKIEQL